MSVVASEFELASCQATVFTPDGDLVGPRLVRFVQAQCGDRFDGEVTVLPPTTAPGSLPFPADVPRATFQSADNQWRLELAAGRANYYWRRQPDTEPIGGFEAFRQTAADLLHPLLAEAECRVGRLGAVISRYVARDEPGIELARHFCKPSWDDAPFNRPETFELHAHKRYQMGEFAVNSWVRSKTGTERLTGRRLLIVEQDINTLPEAASEAAFDPEEIGNFFKTVAGAFDEAFALYYPEEGEAR